MSFSLKDFDLAEMLRCGLDLRRETRECGSMEDAAGSIVRYFHDAFRDPVTGERECALVRFYKTHPFGELERELKGFATAAMGERKPWDAMKCLVLLATAGRSLPGTRATSRAAIAHPPAERRDRGAAPMNRAARAPAGAGPGAGGAAAQRRGGRAGGRPQRLLRPHSAGSSAIPARTTSCGSTGSVGDRLRGIHLSGDCTRRSSLEGRGPARERRPLPATWRST